MAKLCPFLMIKEGKDGSECVMDSCVGFDSINKQCDICAFTHFLPRRLGELTKEMHLLSMKK